MKLTLVPAHFIKKLSFNKSTLKRNLKVYANTLTAEMKSSVLSAISLPDELCYQHMLGQKDLPGFEEVTKGALRVGKLQAEHSLEVPKRLSLYLMKERVYLEKVKRPDLLDWIPKSGLSLIKGETDFVGASKTVHELQLAERDVVHVTKSGSFPVSVDFSDKAYVVYVQSCLDSVFSLKKSLFQMLAVPVEEQICYLKTINVVSNEVVYKKRLISPSSNARSLLSQGIVRNILFRMLFTLFAEEVKFRSEYISEYQAAYGDRWRKVYKEQHPEELESE